MNWMSKRIWLVVVLLAAGRVVLADGPSSSLYTMQDDAPAVLSPEQSPLSDAVAENSFYAVQIPEPRQYAENDLITVIIRESFKTDLKASLDTKKDLKVDGEVSAMIDLDQLLKGIVKPEVFSNGNPAVSAKMKNDWKGEGDYSRSEDVTGRMTARVADVKPNGTLVLEARQTMIHDKEEQTIILTGTCRASDITVDNTVLSTELYDLHLDKQHKGELKSSTKKGIITKFFEALFGA